MSGTPDAALADPSPPLAGAAVAAAGASATVAPPHISRQLPLGLEVVREDIPVPFGKLAYVLRNVFSDDECRALIEFSEKRGYSAALVNVGGGRQVLMTDYRNNDRCIVDDEALAEAFYARLKPHLPATWRGAAAVGLNERLRFLRYYPGQKFDPHMDGVYVRTEADVRGKPSLEHRVGERSYVTVQIYLNRVEGGGETRFLEGTPIAVDPQPGSVLVFQHDIWHEGCAVTAGKKYTIRTDLMFRPPAE